MIWSSKIGKLESTSKLPQIPIETPLHGEYCTYGGLQEIALRFVYFMIDDRYALM